LETVPLFVTEYGTTAADGGNPCVDDQPKNADGTVGDGVCDANNYDSHNASRADEWHAFMDQKRISSCVWSAFNKYEGAALFGSGNGLSFDFDQTLKSNWDRLGSSVFDQTVPANWSDKSLMSPEGQYMFDKLNTYYETAKWKDPTPILNGVDTPLPQGRAQYFDMRGNKLEGEPQVPGVYVARQGGVSRSVVVK
jgi:hypothetical protein